ncbi:MAG: GLPGLI family protein [Marinifilum sp.]|jgi:GLPGLI family protein|nr:GLPGLI family protein [Marinifilum sp.]
MRKTIFIYLLLSVLAVTSKAQNQELFISYNYFMQDYEVEKRAFEVYADQKGSLSVYKSATDMDALLKKIPQAAAVNPNFKVPEKPDIRIYKDYKKQYLISQEKISGKDFFTKEPLNQMQWQLSGKKKKVLEYNCQEATTHFRGRNYIAWFTTEIPFKAAPFKFYGLPGAILQIQTSDGQINIEAKELKIQAQASELKNPFENKKLISWDDFLVIYKKKNKELNIKMKLAMREAMKQRQAMGMDISADKARMNTNMAEPRLEIIIRENDLGYLKKQLQAAKKN